MGQSKRAQKLADKASSSTFAKMCKGFGKLDAGKENKQPEAKALPRGSKEDSGEAPERPNDMVAVNFRISHEVPPDSSISVVGEPEALGRWEPCKGVPLQK